MIVFSLGSFELEPSVITTETQTSVCYLLFLFTSVFSAFQYIFHNG